MADIFLTYKRARFSAQFAVARLYTPAHFWLELQATTRWRVGLTRFGTRMLGETVDFGFHVKPGDAVKPGQVIGWVEGFKAVSDLFCVGTGEFAGINPALEADSTLLNQDPHGQGWLYEFTGTPDETTTDVEAYARQLDKLIDDLSR